MAHAHHSGGVLTMDVLAARSALRDVSPALKASLSVLSLILCVSASDAVVGAAVAISMLYIIWRLGKVSLHRLLHLLQLPLVFLAVSCVVILLEPGEHPGSLARMTLGGLVLCVTQTSLTRALTLLF